MNANEIRECLGDDRFEELVDFLNTPVDVGQGDGYRISEL